MTQHSVEVLSQRYALHVYKYADNLWIAEGAFLGQQLRTIERTVQKAARAWQKAAIEKRVREQLARCLQVDPDADLHKIIDIQIGQERERLESQALEYEDAGGDRPAELVRMLIDDWLPELAQQLRKR